MNDTERATAVDPTGTYVAVDRDDAFEYWSEQVRRLNTARYRTLSDHFRRDTAVAAHESRRR